MPISTVAKGGREWFYISWKPQHICSVAGSKKWMCCFSSQTNCLVTWSRFRWLILLEEGSAALEEVTHKGGKGSIPEDFQDSVRQSHVCTNWETTIVKSQLVVLRVGRPNSSAHKSLPTHVCDPYLPFFPTSVMVKRQNAILYNTLNMVLQKEICYWVFICGSVI